jgi:hypothetical protein
MSKEKEWNNVSSDYTELTLNNLQINY